MNKFEEFFHNVPKKRQVHKWIHYLPIYDLYFKPFIGKNPVILEIGVDKGGSLDMWNYYFDGQCQLYGLDVKNECKQFEKDNIHIIIGDQSDTNVLDYICKNVPQIDIIIDGSHIMSHLITTFKGLYEHVKPGGIYFIEDLHTSYWPEFGGGLRRSDTFIEFSKDLIDEINGFHIREKSQSNLSKSLNALHYYDSILVVEKCVKYTEPYAIIKTPEIS